MHMSERVLAVDVREAARQLSLSPRTVASLVARRELRSRKVGRRRIIPVAALEAFIIGRTGGIARRAKVTYGKKAVPEAGGQR
jgi:excisionase family DNA binding protein